MRADLTYTIRSGEVGPDPEPEKAPSPTNIVIDNVNNTLSWTNSIGFATSDHEYCIDYTKSRTWREVTVKPILIGNVDLIADDIAIRVKAQTGNLESDALVADEGFTSTVEVNPGLNYFTPTEREALASYIHYAKGALKEDGTPAASGDNTNQILAIKGGKDLFYNGTETPMLTQGSPIYSDHGLGSVSFDNEPEVIFELQPDFTTGERIPPPLEYSYVMMPTDGTPFEAYSNGWGTYIANSGSTTRIMHNNKVVPGSTAPEYYKISHLHVCVKATTARLWINGVYQGSVDYTEAPFDILYGIRIGTTANNSQWEFIAHHLFDHELTEQERNDFFIDVHNKFHIGQEKQLPRAENIKITESGGVYTAGYDYVNPLGLAEDTTKTVYRWVWMGPLNLADQRILPQTGKSITVAEIPTSAIDLKVEVQVFDIHGNTWKRISDKWDTNVSGKGTL